MSTIVRTLLAGVLLWGLAPSASAVEPVVTEGAFDITQPAGWCAFPVEIRFVGTFRFTQYFDGDGNLEAIAFRAPDTATATNLTNGNTLTGHEMITIHADVRGRRELPREFRTGVPIHFNAPGGTVLIDAGRSSLDAETGEFTIVGNHQVHEGDFAAFCEALS